MQNVTFITGNENKAKEMSRLLGYSLKHQNLEFDEIQELDLEKLISYKVRQAYKKLKSPVLVEDTSLEFGAMNKLPGPFIKWFLKEIGSNGLCQILNSFSNRSATAVNMFAYYDGKTLKIFKKSIVGTITKEPIGNNGFGWDSIFIPERSTKTRGEMNHDEQDKFTPRRLLIPEIKKFFESI